MRLTIICKIRFANDVLHNTVFAFFRKVRHFGSPNLRYQTGDICIPISVTHYCLQGYS